MKHTILFLIGCAFLVHFQAKAQAEDYDPYQYIAWNEYYNLSWENFKGHPANGSFGNAGTAVKIQAKPYKSGKNIHYKVYALFDKNKSWATDTSPELLSHEQLHFDIAELYARKIRKKVAELSARNEKDLKKYNGAIQKILEESNQADRQYDIETLHGAIKDKQEKWHAKIKHDLKLLEAYKKPVRIIGK